jgi:hypothetical protein
LFDFAPDTAELVSITSATPTPTPTPVTITKATQTINWDSIEDSYLLSQGELSFTIYASSGGQINGESLDTSICDLYVIDDTANVIFNSAGDCELSFWQDGNEQWEEITDYISLQILGKAKKSKPKVSTTASKKPSVSGSASASDNSKKGSVTGKVSGKISGGSASKKITITCKKGSSVKKITDVKPVCPVGYKKS